MVAASPEKKTDATCGKKRKSSPDYASWAARLLAECEASAGDAASKLPAGLYVVAVPIGNLGDITLRALQTLAGCDAVACEDTRVTGGLLHRYGIKQKLISYHDHNALGRQPELLARLAAGEAVALVSDAGTPLISDPGYKLVQACRAAGYPVTALPGASALLTALACGGLPTDQFLFAGFLPSKPTAREKALLALKSIPATLVFYEAPPRLDATLAAMAKIFGAERPAAVARELTKLYETVETGTLAELAARFHTEKTPKGEIVLMIAPPAPTQAEAPPLDALLREALRTHSLRDAVAAVSAATGIKKSEVYQRALGVGGEKTK